MPLPTPPPELFGPIPVRAQSSFNHLVFQAYPEKYSVLEKGERVQMLHTDIGNTSFLIYTKIGQEWSEDAEMQQLRYSYRQGIGKGWEVGAETRLLSRNGGIFDGIISAWHRYILFNLHDDFRDSNGRNTQNLSIVQGGKLVLLENQASTVVPLLALTAKRQITPSLSLRTTLKIPLNSRYATKHYLDDGATDVSLGLSGKLPTRGRFTPQIDASLLYAGTNHIGTSTAFQDGKRLNIQMVIAGEYHLNDDAHLVLQQENATFPYSFNLAKAPLRRQQMTLGYVKKITPKATGFLAISENLYGPIVVGYAPDVQFSLGMQWGILKKRKEIKDYEK